MLEKCVCEDVNLFELGQDCWLSWIRL